jgi:SAM-dependent methyltransferase
LNKSNPLGRFSGLADIYAKCRPTYPAEAIDFVVSHCGLQPGGTLVDVGSGTGISSRLFGQRGVQVIGLEPNPDMRRQASAEASPPHTPAPRYQEGRAEATGLPGGVADVVLAAQAFHWFEPETTLPEFQRILKPGGWVVLMWNERDETDPFTAAYGAVMRSAPNAAAVEVPRGRAGEVLLSHAVFQDAERRLFRNNQVLDEEALLGRAFSASYAPADPSAREVFSTNLRAVFAQYQRGGQVVLRYETSVYVARRR